MQNFELVLSGPGITERYIIVTYGPYDFKDDGNNSTTEAVNPQAVFFIQVENNKIVRSDNVSVGENLSSDFDAVDRFHAKFCGRLMSFISLLLEDLDIVEKPVVSCHSREIGNPETCEWNT